MTANRKPVREPTKFRGLSGGDSPVFENLAEEKKARSRLNKKLNQICKRKYPLNIPWGLISESVMSEGFVMPMLHGLDDNKPGRVHEQIGKKTWLVVQWYPNANDTFEITAYAS
jgi:hypothetical protein